MILREQPINKPPRHANRHERPIKPRHHQTHDRSTTHARKNHHHERDMWEKEAWNVKRERRDTEIDIYEYNINIIFWHCATVPLYIYDGTVAQCQKNLQFYKFSKPTVEYFWGLMLNISNIWHLQFPLWMLLRVEK